jgi:hypothetical protein
MEKLFWTTWQFHIVNEITMGMFHMASLRNAVDWVIFLVDTRDDKSI